MFGRMYRYMNAFGKILLNKGKNTYIVNLYHKEQNEVDFIVAARGQLYISERSPNDELLVRFPTTFPSIIMSQFPIIVYIEVCIINLNRIELSIISKFALPSSRM